MQSSLDNDLALHRKRRQRRIRVVIAVCLSLFLVLTFLENRVFQLGTVPFPVSGNVLVFALINVNVILLLLMVFFTMRNLVELVFDRKLKLVGTTLRTKLVISFVSLSLIPTTLLFFISLQFVSTSMDYWFNSNVESSLEASLSLAQDVYQGVSEKVRQDGLLIAGSLSKGKERHFADVQGDLQSKITTFKLAGLSVFAKNHQQVIEIRGAVGDAALPSISAEQLRRALSGENGLIASQPSEAGELLRSLTPFERAGERYVLVTTVMIPKERLARLELISKGIQGYRQLLLLKQPIKSSFLVMLLIITLLIIFSAIWFAFYVAGGLTRPMAKLSQGIKQVADGELDFVLEKDSDDEMGMLVDSFNSMTRDLLSSRLQVEEGSLALQRVNLETEKRRRYTEIILENVTAGVISLDAQNRVLTINKFAEELLKIRTADLINKNYKSILRLSHLSILESFFVELAESGRNSIQRSIKVTVNDEALSLRVNFTKLEDEENQPLGVVIVFDNLTEIEKIQRMAAWREVARRIAHEVKNPLTPIQLSAQRLRKRYLEKLALEGEVFDQCTTTIINQVDELKHLVDEFSSFARMPAVKKTLNHLGAMVSEVMILYQEGHKEITFVVLDQGVPAFYFDAEQMKRVLVNLLDNAVAALRGHGRVEVEIYVQSEEGLVIMEVRDNGPGVSESNKIRLFEPYFSTKKSGTGLGLAIASTVVADHGGYIRVKDNVPVGARFIIELPLLTVV
ncbi:MAG: ATP-binding protein [Desulfobulbaceae bacterium]|nr:ATP-binding protein [Desulfobulbaceae bacterium]